MIAVICTAQIAHMSNAIVTPLMPMVPRRPQSFDIHMPIVKTIPVMPNMRNIARMNVCSPEETDLSMVGHPFTSITARMAKRRKLCMIARAQIPTKLFLFFSDPNNVISP